MVSFGALMTVIALLWFIALVISLLFNLFAYLQKKLSSRLQVKKPETTQLGFLKRWGLAALTLALAFCIGIRAFATDINSTILNQDFVLKGLNELSLRSIAGEMISRDLPVEQQYVSDTIEATLNELGPELKADAILAVSRSYDFFLGKEPVLRVTVPLEPVQEALRRNLEAALLKSVPELQGASPETIKMYVDETYDRTFGRIPARVELSPATSLPGIPVSLEQVRQAFTIIRLGRWYLLLAIVLLILGIILLTRDFKTTALRVGSAFVVSGVIGLFAAFVLQIGASTVNSLETLTASQKWLIQVIVDTLSTLKKPGIYTSSIGVALVLLSFLYGPRQMALVKRLTKSLREKFLKSKASVTPP